MEQNETMDEWAQISIEKKELMIQIGYGLFLYLFIALFVLFIPINFRTIWVLVNITIGYAIFSSKKARDYYWDMFLGFKKSKVWLYAILNLLLIVSVLAVPMFLQSSATSANGGDSEANPFVSNYIFLLFIIPIIPLFADAETRIFQGWIIKGLNSKHLVKCGHCGENSLPNERCDLCGNMLPGDHVVDISQYYPAIILSGLIFGFAHVILVGSVYPMILTIGGVLLGYLYVKEGAWLVARVHMVYDYLVIAIIIVGVLA